MQKKVLIGCMAVVALFCIIIIGLWAFSAANTKPSCSIVKGQSGSDFNNYLNTLSSSDRVDVTFKLLNIENIFNAKSAEVFGQNTDYKCPTNVAEFNVNYKLTTKSGTELEIVYSKTGDYTAKLGVKANGKDLYE